MGRYDIFISYKRKSLPTANNLYYRLTTRGYSTFFDLEEMGRDNFNVQLLNYIELLSANGLSLLGGATTAIAKVKGREWIKEKIRKFISLESGEVGHHLVENISYDDAWEFIRRLSKMTNIVFSLPTGDDWEYAARGGQKSQGFKYAGSDELNEVAWYRNNADGLPIP